MDVKYSFIGSQSDTETTDPLKFVCDGLIYVTNDLLSTFDIWSYVFFIQNKVIYDPQLNLLNILK